MSAGKANCLVCGEPIVYWEEAREVTCVICGKTEIGHSICEAGHYVCDACHRSEGVDYIMGLCSGSMSVDPVEIMTEAMNDKSIYARRCIAHHGVCQCGRHACERLDEGPGARRAEEAQPASARWHVRLLGRLRCGGKRRTGAQRHKRLVADDAGTVGTVSEAHVARAWPSRRAGRTALLQARRLRGARNGRSVRQRAHGLEDAASREDHVHVLLAQRRMPAQRMPVVPERRRQCGCGISAGAGRMSHERTRAR